MNKPLQSNIIRDSHYVPKAVLKRWSLNKTHVFAYQLLVPDDRVPEWEEWGIRRLASQRDLYTIFAGGQERDDFEKWLNLGFEHRGLEAIDRLVRGSQLTQEDWRSMIVFLAAQDLRTPQSYIEMMERWHNTLPDLLSRTMRESTRELDEAREQGIVLSAPPVENEFSDLLKVTIEPSNDPASDKAVLKSELSVGRGLWIASLRHLLTGAPLRALCSHRWSVAEPANGFEWPLTDHPVLRLNYYEPGRYDFKGGWGNPGTEIMMPVSPKHLLYVRVGQKAPNRLAFDPKLTAMIQKFLVERAHRWVFATQPAEWVAEVRRRTVSRELFQSQEKAWEDFHRDQLPPEARFDTD